MFTNHEATPTTRVLLTMATTAAGGQKKNTEPCHLCRRPINDSRNRRTLGSRTSECATTAIDRVCSELGRCRNDFELRSVCKPCFQDLEGLGKAEAKIALLRARFLGYLRPRASIGLSPSPAKRTASIAVHRPDLAASPQSAQPAILPSQQAVPRVLGIQRARGPC